MKRQKETSLFIMMLAAAFVLRLGYAFYYFHGGSPYEIDIDDYASLAKNLLERGEYSVAPGEPSIYREPGFPFFLAILFALFGARPWTVALGLNFVNVLTCAAIFLMTKRVFSRPTAWLALAIACFYPYFIYYSLHPYREIMLAMLAALAIYFLILYQQGQQKKHAALAAICSGLAALCKSSTLPYIVLAAAVLAWLGTNRKEALKNALLYVSLSALIYSPWILRNRLIFGSWTISTPSAALHMYQSLVIPQDQYGTGQEIEARNKDRLLKLDVKSRNLLQTAPAYWDSMFYQATLQWIRRNPKKYLKILGEKFLKFWRFYPAKRHYKLTTQSYGAIKWVSLLSDGILIPLGLLGLFLLKRPQAAALVFPLLFVACETLSHMFYHSGVRFRLPSMCFVIILASWALMRAAQALKIYEPNAS